MRDTESRRHRLFDGIPSYLFAAAIALIAFLPPRHGAAQTPTGEVARKMLERDARLRFAGWQTVGFYCVLDPIDQTNKGLCDWTAERFRLLGAQSKVQVRILSEDGFTRGYESGMNKDRDVLELELQVLATPVSGASVGIAVRLFASANAEQWRADDKDDAKAKPRPGSLVIWEKAFILSAPGRGSALDNVLRNSVERDLMAFFAEFLAARP